MIMIILSDHWKLHIKSFSFNKNQFLGHQSAQSWKNTHPCTGLPMSGKGEMTEVLYRTLTVKMPKIVPTLLVGGTLTAGTILFQKPLHYTIMH